MGGEKQSPWASGPGELLQHGVSLLKKDSDVNRRLAMISIDNAVELMIKTYLGLPKRVTGIKISRKEYSQICESFPQLIDALEQNAEDRRTGIDLGQIEWYHRLRNQLYHQGNGLTVEREKVDVYAELAQLLFSNLFDYQIRLNKSSDTDSLGEYIAAWVDIESILNSYPKEITLPNGNKRTLPLMPHIQYLLDRKIIQADHFNALNYHRHKRNKIIHGESDSNTVITRNEIDGLKKLAEELKTSLKNVKFDR